MPWLTRDEASTPVEVTIAIPGGQGHLADLLGALLSLTEAENWQEHESLTPEEAAAAWWECYKLIEGLNP